MKIHGKIIDTNPKERVIKLLCFDKIIYLYFQRKDFREFGPYFFEKPYLFVEVNEKRKKIGKHMTYEVATFLRVVQPQVRKIVRKRLVFFDMETIRKGVRNIINKPGNKMFIDLEFTMPSYYQTMAHVHEIIQYGIIIEDKSGKIVFEDSSLVKPHKPYNINGRTLKFLSLKREDFAKACVYKDFYNTLQQCLKTYNPKVYVWGRSDILAIEQSFKINNVKPLDIRKQHINLMQIIKNYYNHKDEMGLFQTYEEFSNTTLSPQQHDAFEDAMITREIFNMFKYRINSTE